MEIVPELAVGLPLSGLCLIDQNVAVHVVVVSVAAQKTVIRVPAAQEIGQVIGDQVFVVHPVIGFPGGQQVEGVIQPDLHILMGGQLAEEVAAGERPAPSIEAVHQDLYLHAPLRCVPEGAHHVPAALLVPKVEGSQNDLFLGGLNEPEPPQQSVLVVVDAPDPLRGGVRHLGLRLPVSGTGGLVDQGRNDHGQNQEQKPQKNCQQEIPRDSFHFLTHFPTGPAERPEDVRPGQVHTAAGICGRSRRTAGSGMGAGAEVVRLRWWTS